MILEAAMLQVKKGMESEFETAFADASTIIASRKGYVEHDYSAVSRKKVNTYS